MDHNRSLFCCGSRTEEGKQEERGKVHLYIHIKKVSTFSAGVTTWDFSVVQILPVFSVNL